MATGKRVTSTGIPIGAVQRDVTGKLPSFLIETGEIVSFEDEIGEDIEGYSDAGEILTAELNEFLEEVGDFTKFEVDEITDWLKSTCTPVQLSAYMTNKLAHGIILGRFLEFQNIITEIENEDEEGDEGV